MGSLSVLADAGSKDTETAQCHLRDIQRSPLDGLGKSEPLKGNLRGWWSRRIDETNRIVYYEQNGIIHIASCRGHYEK